jgi:hypothetical protein
MFEARKIDPWIMDYLHDMQHKATFHRYSGKMHGHATIYLIHPNHWYLPCHDGRIFITSTFFIRALIITYDLIIQEGGTKRMHLVIVQARF